MQISPQDEGLSLAIADSTGAPLATIEELQSKPLDTAQLKSQSQEGLLALEWTELPLAKAAEPPEEVELLRCEVEGADAEAARKATQEALEAIQAWIADEDKADSRLALITEGAIATK